jgi:hypothetical protein
MLGGGGPLKKLDDGYAGMVPYVLPADMDDGHAWWWPKSVDLKLFHPFL